MTTISRPATPADDLAAWRARPEADIGAGVLSPDLCALAQGGVSVTIATCGPDGRPIAGSGVACRMRPGGTLRILLSRPDNEALLRSVEAGGRLAVTFTRARDHRAFQVKADRAQVLPIATDDVPELERQTAVFRDELVEIGFTPALAAGFTAYDPDGIVALELTPDRAFVQTPGPGAGSELTR